MPVLHVGSWVVLVPIKLKRYYGRNDLHFVTFSCYGRRPLLDTAFARNVFVKVLDAIRKRYAFRLVGYVVMPEHVHFLISEPKLSDPSEVVKALKYRTSVELRQVRAEERRAAGCKELLPHFWQARFYDFNVYTNQKLQEKLDYMHWNPLTRRLVEDPREWIWSSYLFYETGIQGIIRIDPE
jgi:putative transposase